MEFSKYLGYFTPFIFRNIDYFRSHTFTLIGSQEGLTAARMTISILIEEYEANSGYTNIDYSAVFSDITEENASFIEKITELSNNANIEQQLSVFQYIVVASPSES